MRTLIVLVIIALLSTANAGGQSTKPISLSARLGIAWAPRNRPACVVLADSALPRGLAITILWPPANQVGGPTITLVQATLGDRVDDCGWIGENGYGLDVKLATYVPYLAIIGETGHVTDRRTYVEIDLGAGGHQSVKACTSMEGVHFTVWQGRPFESERLYHTYAPLGYDVEPSCTDAETREPSDP